MKRGFALAPALFVLAGCPPPAVPPDPGTAAASASASATASAPASASASASASATASAPASAAAAPPPPAISLGDAKKLLFPDGLPAGTSCENADERAHIRCLIEARYKDASSAKTLALALYESSGSVAGVEQPYIMEGGFRGSIKIVPELPVGRYEKHLDWIKKSSDDFLTFFTALKDREKVKPIRYRHAPIAWKFLRSVGRTTPSAYASNWSIGYNVSGSLHSSLDAVRETLFHEIFHLNDGTRLDGPVQWSRKELGAIHDAILAKCGTRVACLKPYAPMPTMVRGGTYYSFQPDNGDAVNEYAAELATRYYREHRAILRGEKPISPAFKCEAPENAKAWKILLDEYFGGIDLVPSC